MTIEQFIRHLPKAELHMHIEGSLEPELMFALSKRNNIEIPFKTVEEVRNAYHFTDLQSFLNIYYAGMSVLRTEQDYYDLTFAYLQRVQQQNVRHTEIFFDAQAHTNRGVTFATVIKGIRQALVDGEKQFGITSKLILSILRDLSEDSAFATLEEALPFKDWIVAIGLSSQERGNPPEKFQRVFAKAQNHGFLTVAHAGEEGSPEYIWQAIELLKVSRIDHGVRCMLDSELIKHLKLTQIPLTVCPLSNVKLHVYERLEDHPLKQMLENNLCATINSDDPAYFGGYVEENYSAAQNILQLSKDQLLQLARNSFTASFLSEQEKQFHLQQIEACKTI